MMLNPSEFALRDDGAGLRVLLQAMRPLDNHKAGELPMHALDMRDRRSTLGLMGGAIVAAAGVSDANGAQEAFFKRHGLSIGLQLYTLGPELAANLDSQLKTLQAIGFKTVELAGFMGRTPKQLRAAFDSAGISCPSAHIPAEAAGNGELTLASADLGALAEAMHDLGVQTVIAPTFFLPERFKAALKASGDTDTARSRIVAQMTADDWKVFAEFLNGKGRALEKFGLKIGYHNHNLEFAPVGKTTGLELLLEATDPAIVSFEMDAGWVMAAGADPLPLLKKYSGRFGFMHVKDLKASTVPNYATRMDPTELGSGIAKWHDILPAAYAAGVRHFIIEQEPPFARPRIESARMDFNYLNTIVA
jgi:sugar phosphate isomerase/epimerase